jgi:hypothetical protein
VTSRARARRDVESALGKAAEDMKKYDNAHRGPTPVYKQGEKVWLDASDITTTRPMKKLDHKRLEPYEITEVLSNNTYKLKLPSSLKIHPVFSVVKLKTFIPNEIPEQAVKPPPPPVVFDGVEEYEVEDILDSRLYRGKVQYLIKWKDYPTEDNTWEPASMILEDIPKLVKKFHNDYPHAIHSIAIYPILEKEFPLSTPFFAH